MNQPNLEGARTRRWNTAIGIAAIAALVCKQALALFTYGTNDAYRYQQFYFWSHAIGVAIYKYLWDFNHPPSMIHILAVMGWLGQTTALPFPFWLRIPGILADAGSVWLVWKLLGARLRSEASRGTVSTALALLLLAVAPVAIMVSGFHGNTDGVLIFFVLLAVWLAEQEQPAWLVGAAFGAALCFKVSPIVAAPAMLLYQNGLRRRLQFLAGMVAVPLLAWQPYLLQDPAQIWKNVFGYRSLYGIWGISFLTSQTPLLAWLNTGFRALGPYLVLGACTAAAVYMNTRRNKPTLYVQVGFIFFLFLALSSGFGVQYLLWLAPWVVELGALPAAIYFAASGIFLFSVYNFWCQGLPWYVADSNRIGPWVGYMEWLQLLVWASVLMLTWLAWHRIRLPESLPQQVPQDPPHRAWAIFGAAALAVFLFTATQWASLQRTGAPLHNLMGPAYVDAIQQQSQRDLAATLAWAETHKTLSK